ncbi:MAG TPA: hypothetical protein PKD63_12460 [Solirubrobacteraceae bacterium]|nr:hypothetical protein [Solirubrobacteraceae bacterium]
MRPRVTVLAVLCLAVVSGCGGDDEPGTTGASAAAPTRAAFIAQGDAVCRQTNARIAASNARIARINRTATDAKQALADAAPVFAETYDEQRGSVERFRALTPPAGDEQTGDTIVAGIEQQVALVGQASEAAAAGDVAQLQELGTQLRSTRTRVRGLLQGYGFKECGRADGSGG